ncbi:major facilitator superfamily transporter [Colletotrichum sojae]|uniref:Major facilitator superfamily transporter n=1 Tax=Colletotrichum sojae TaxID=2175907 RepID=A0A8H6ILS7_9PEZI|nr:major facilitator superfamily transporter [Colletotrichum sojae]
MFGFGKKGPAESISTASQGPVANHASTRFSKAIVPVIACGAGLFSDGYINNVIGSVTTTLALQYGDLYKDSEAKKFASNIAFVGTVVGQLIFGWLADKWSRTNSLIVSTVILVVFTALATGSYYHGDAIGMFNMLATWRFFVGIGIGGEYPAGSVSCAESTSGLKSGSRNKAFIFSTATAIDVGFVMGAFVPWAVAAAYQNSQYEVIWRTSMGVGVLFPLVLFVLRLYIKEPEEFQHNSMRHAKTPYLLSLRFYGWRLLCVSLIWFIYDFSAYSFGIYSSTILSNLYGDTAPLTTVFGWNTVINLFLVPGTALGALASDWMEPRYQLALGTFLQALVGFFMAGFYEKLSQPGTVGAFVVVFGIFMALGEAGPGNCCGLMASKTCATGIRGQYYGIASAIGKMGAFVGTLACSCVWSIAALVNDLPLPVFPYIQAAAGKNAVASAQYPFWVSSSLCVLNAGLALCLPRVGQDTIALEDARFREFLMANGYDTSQLGLKSESPENGGVVA